MFQQYFPCIKWLATYNTSTFSSDMVAAVIVTIMLIPQSLAYALLAGLPPETGLYASIFPLLAYAVFGTSRTLAVGPVAVVSLMTAAAVGSIPEASNVTHLQAAMLLALMSGCFLLGLGMFRAGFLANFLSHPVVSGFITSSGIIIALSQLKHLLGIDASGDNILALSSSIFTNFNSYNVSTLLIGTSALLFLICSRTWLKKLLQRTSLSPFLISLLVRTAPIFAVILTSLAAWWWRLDTQGVKLIGVIPAGLPSPQLPIFNVEAFKHLFIAAIMISIIGYVESISVGKTLATRKRQKIIPNQELVGLGAANIVSGLSGGFPVTGGFSRSVVNFDAGAETPAASIFTAVGIAITALFLTDYLVWLPNATLAATIIIAVLSLVDFSILKSTYNYAVSDFIAVVSTMTATLLFGVEVGVSCGVGASLFLHLYKTTKPHIAIVGEIPGTQHFRNVLRHKVITYPSQLSLRVDESLYFANASFIEDEIFKILLKQPELKHVLLMCTAVNEIDISALEVLENINLRLKEMQIGFHLTEVKGPVMDTLVKSQFLSELNGQVFLSHHLAVQTLLQNAQSEATKHPDYLDYQI